jgi:hypothetical protein
MNFSSLSVPSAPALPGMDEIRQRLQRMIPTLAEFGRREEAQFVQIGEALGSFLQRSRGIARYSDEVIDSLLRQEGDEVLLNLSELMKGLEEHIAQLRATARLHEESLQQVTVHIHHIEAPLQSLSKVVKILYSLSFSTKVEGTQGHSVVELQTLAEDLKELAAKIDSKTIAVRDRLKIMMSLAQGARAKTQTMAEVSLRVAGINLQQCRCLIEGVTSRRTAALDDARFLNGDTVTISAAIDEVISSVQFHDITRQQVEHIQLALENFCGQLVVDDSAEHLAVEAADLCRIQAAQLRHTQHELVSAVVRIITSLRGIAPAVKHLAHKTRHLSATTETTGDSLFSDVEPVLAVVTGIIDEADLEGRQVIGAVTAVLEVLSELSQLLQEVESIGIEMKMISFNAGITAAHNLERGAGLGVIARSIQSLSSEVLSRTGEFAADYVQLERLACELNNSINSALPQDGRGTTQLTESAVAFMARLQAINLGVVQLMSTLDDEALSLAADVVATADKITIHVEAGNIIDQLVTELESLAGSIHGDVELAGEAKILDLFSRNYTMQSERRVHAEVRHSGAVGVEAAGQDRTGLGVNVELF